MRWEIAEYRRRNYSPTTRWLQERFDIALSLCGRMLGSAVDEGSVNWHRALHLLSLLPSTSGSVEFRAAFLRSSMAGVTHKVIAFPGLLITYPQNVTIGPRVFINRNVFINALAPISIGADCLIGPNVVMNSGNHSFDRLDIPINQQPHELSPISIGDDVWIGANCVLTAGTKIGAGTVVGAGAVVTGELPSGCVAAGVPARVIRLRRRHDAH